MVAINDSLIDYGYKVTFRVVLILLINRALTLGLGCALGNKLALCVAGQTEMAKCFAKFIKKIVNWFLSKFLEADMSE